MLNRRQFIKSLAAALALTVFPYRNGWALCCRDDALLDFAAAIRFREKNPFVLNSYRCDDLSSYTRATPEALNYLAKPEFNAITTIKQDQLDKRLVIVGMEKLDKKNALALADWNAVVAFINLEYLDADVAAIISGGSNDLIFENLSEISPTAARELAKLPHSLSLHLKATPSEQTLHTLCNHAGNDLFATWECQPYSALCCFSSSNKKKKVIFELPIRRPEGKWTQRVNIVNSESPTDLPISKAKFITVL